MSRPEDSFSPDSGESMHDNQRSSELRKVRRKWRLEIERDRSMRAYQQNPRALVFACDPCECDGADGCLNCGPQR